MGLKQVKFSAWFQTRFPDACKTVPHSEVAHFDSVFIDINCILHPALRAAKTEAAFVKKLYFVLNKLLAQYVPDRICYLSVDGPAPLAKMLTQKARRADKGTSSSKKKSGGLSALQVTPGCPFMSRLEQYLSYYTVRYLQQRQHQGISPDLKFVIDHSQNPGEGESKIIENLVQQRSNIRGRPCAILSMDSDAILQAIAISMPNLYVVRQDAALPSVVISVDNFMHALEQIFPGESNRVRLDFCALCLFRGNDYLRGLPVVLEKLWVAYMFTKLTDPLILARKSRYLLDADLKTFDLLFLRQLLWHSQKHVSKLGVPTHMMPSRRVHALRTIAVDSHKDIGQDNLEVEQESLDDTQDNETAVASSESESEVLEEEEGEGVAATYEGRTGRSFSVQKYLEGVLWNLEMYCSGKCPDVSFTYGYQFGPPRFAVVDYIDKTALLKPHQALLPSTTKALLGVTTSQRQYLHPLLCALMLLPSTTGASFLPESIAKVHVSIVSSPGQYLSLDEMDSVDMQVLQVMAALKQNGDFTSAQELLELYTVRAPYIWTRVRNLNRARTPATMPPSPNVLMVEADRKAGRPQTQNDGKPFEALENQADIICNVVKVFPPHGQSDPHQTGYERWASQDRQQELTFEGQKQLTRWPFYYQRAGAFRGGFRGMPRPSARPSGRPSPGPSPHVSQPKKTVASPILTSQRSPPALIPGQVGLLQRQRPMSTAALAAAPVDAQLLSSSSMPARSEGRNRSKKNPSASKHTSRGQGPNAVEVLTTRMVGLTVPN